ncbi:MAG: glycosyltransferase family 39 protein [Planctomycetota bacterium]
MPATPPFDRGERHRLGLVLALALLVRCLGLGWGLPHAEQGWSYHPDEYRLADAAARVVEEPTLHPTSFKYGSLAVYLPAAVGAPLAWTGLVHDARGWHLVTRGVSVVLGVATVAAVWLLARRLVGPRAAPVAALALALAPGHALLSGYATPDVPSTFFVTLALWFAVRGLEPGGERALWASAAAGGLAAAIKYGAGAVVLAPLVAALASPRERPLAHRARTAIGLGLASVAVFAACLPAAVTDWKKFTADLEYELILHPRAGHDNLFTDTGDGWTYHLTANLPYLLGWPLVAVALVGCVLLARRGLGGALVVGFALVLFALLGSSEVRFMRYLTPILPALCVGVGALALTRGRLAAQGAIAYAALLTTAQAVGLLLPDPRDRALAFVESELAPHAAIGTVETPTFFHPPFTPENGGPGIRKRFRAALEAGASPYRFPKPTGLDATALATRDLDAFALSEHDWRDALRLDDPHARAFLDALDARFPSRTTFHGLPGRLRRCFDWGVRPTPHDWLYPFMEQTILLEVRR